MDVLVACESSARVRDAFCKRGHNAWSCDLEPTEGNPTYHHQCDIRQVLFGYRWDLVIAHPPCTFLSNSGVRWLYRGGRTDGGPDLDRWADMGAACEFFRMFFEGDWKLCVENPVMHGHGLKRIGMQPTQTIQPWQFGHGETKATCLWLRGLPPLEPTSIVEGRTPRVHHESPGPERAKNRSRTYLGIAAAMAAQWG